MFSCDFCVCLRKVMSNILSNQMSLRSELWYPLRFPHKPMFCSSLAPVFFKKGYVLFTYRCLTYWLCRCFIRGKKCLPFVGSSPVFGEVRVALLSSLCCVVLFCLSLSCGLYPILQDFPNGPFLIRFSLAFIFFMPKQNIDNYFIERNQDVWEKLSSKHLYLYYSKMPQGI